MSLFDQYNGDSQRSNDLDDLGSGYNGTVTHGGGDVYGMGAGGGSPSAVLNGMMGSGFVNTQLEALPPMFAKKLVDYAPPAAILHLIVSKNVLAMALDNGSVIRLDLERPEDLEEISVSRKGEESIYKLFLDQSGCHMIISLSSGTNFYLNSSSKKVKMLNKMKGIVIESIAWSKVSSRDTSTKEILIGTTQGEIYEAEIEPNDSGFFREREEKYFKRVYEIGGATPQAVTGLMMEVFPVTSGTNIGLRKTLILATTKTRIYQFIGFATLSDTPIFQNVFDQYKLNPGFRELPGDIGRSELHFFKHNEEEMASTFAWMTGAGIFHGSFLFGNQEVGDSVMTDTSLLPYQVNPSRKLEAPVSMVLTEFHLLMAYKDRVEATCLLNEEVVYDDLIPRRFGNIIAMSRDPLFGTVWVYTSDCIFELVITREDRNMWKLYLDRQMYDIALVYCKDNPSHYDQVVVSQANSYYEQGKYVLAASYYAKTQAPLEEVALKFINKGEDQAVRSYLEKKFFRLSSMDEMQRTMIGTWLVELYLNRLNELEDNKETAEFGKVQKEFENLLRQRDVKYALDVPTTYQMMSSHGRVEELLFFAEAIGDHEKVIGFHVQQKQYSRALHALSKQNDIDLYYRFSSVLLQNAPSETINAWMKEVRLDPRKLIPSLVRFDNKMLSSVHSHQIDEGIRYLEFCVSRPEYSEPAIHNYLVSLYARKSDESYLYDFLRSQGDSPVYDPQYALRLCIQEDKRRCCIFIYGMLGMYEEAVGLALSVDLELAKLNADKPVEDEALRKKLWLKVARHVVEEEQDIQKAMAYLNQSDLLKIEDILPFFPDFVTIDHFKGAICSSLEDYNRHIEDLKTEMREATDSSSSIRSDVLNLRNKYGVVMANQKCCICNFALLSRPFYLFPCQHSFHSDCLLDEASKGFTRSQKQRVSELKRQLSKSTPRRIVTADAEDNEQLLIVPQNEELHRSELDDIIASECVLCGSSMIKCVDQPFFSREEFKTRDEFETEVSSWKL